MQMPHSLLTFAAGFRQVLLAYALMFAAGPLLAADSLQINDLSVLADPAGKETIETVSRPERADAFRAVQYGFAGGYTRAVHWLRFTLHAPPPDAAGRREVMLEIHPPFLDDLQLYLSRADAPGGFEVRRAGDSVPFTAREYPYRAFVHRITFDDDRPLVGYVRLATTSSSVMVLKVWEPRLFLQAAAHEYGLLGMMIGLMLVGIIVNLWNGLWRREILYQRFLLYLVTATLTLLGTNGLVAEYLLPNAPYWANHWTSLGNLLVIAAGAHFYRYALDIAHAGRFMRWLYSSVVWLALLSLPTPFFDFYTEAASLLVSLAILLLVAGTLRSVQLWRRRERSARYLLAAHLFTLLCSGSAALTLIGLLPGQFWLIYGLQIGHLGTLLALQMLLAQRVRVTAMMQVQSRIATERAEAAAQEERVARENQARFLAMLIHELKTPLSVIRLFLGAHQPSLRMKGHADDSVSEIDAIIDRCALANRIDDKAIAAHIQPCRLDEILSELRAMQNAPERVSFQGEGDALAALLQTDLVLLRTVLGNLLDNALKYAPPDATVQIFVSMEAQAGHSGIMVQMENPVGPAGWPDPVHLFEKYYRAPGARSQGGSGLGLYIVKALTVLLGGDIRLIPHSRNVCFELWLPFSPHP